MGKKQEEKALENGAAPEGVPQVDSLIAVQSATPDTSSRPVADAGLGPVPLEKSLPDSVPLKTPDDLVAASVSQAQSAPKRKGGPGRPKKSDKPIPAPVADEELMKVGVVATAEAEISLFSILFGDKFQSGHYGRDDRSILETGWRYYFRVYGMAFLPGWLVLVMAHFAYFGQRIADKENKAKIASSFAGLKRFFKKDEGKKDEGKAETKKD